MNASPKLQYVEHSRTICWTLQYVEHYNDYQIYHNNMFAELDAESDKESCSVDNKSDFSPHNNNNSDNFINNNMWVPLIF